MYLVGSLPGVAVNMLLTNVNVIMQRSSHWYVFAKLEFLFHFFYFLYLKRHILK